MAARSRLLTQRGSAAGPERNEFTEGNEGNEEPDGLSRKVASKLDNRSAERIRRGKIMFGKIMKGKISRLICVGS